MGTVRLVWHRAGIADMRFLVGACPCCLCKRRCYSRPSILLQHRRCTCTPCCPDSPHLCPCALNLHCPYLLHSSWRLSECPRLCCTLQPRWSPFGCCSCSCSGCSSGRRS